MNSRYICRRCGTDQPSWLIFESRGRYYCLDHIPWTVRIWMRLRGVS